jgi:hypothetical protein
MDNASDFAFDFQQLSNNCSDHVTAIKAALYKHIHNINREKTSDSVVVFNDGSSAEWIGNGWLMKK